MTARQAIDKSILRDMIVHIEYSEDQLHALLVECDDNVENGPVHEFWGRDENGDRWRVHMDLPLEAR